MGRFVGIKAGKVCIVADHPPNSANYQVVPVPPEMEHISAANLMMARVVDGKLYHRLARKPLVDLRIAVVTNYRAHCGISTYAEQLFPEITKLVKDLHLFVEHNSNPTSALDNATQCWTRGQPLYQLAQAITAYNPDIVLINHEFGIFPDARFWLALMTQLSDYRVIVIMHSIFPDHQDKTIVEAAMPEIVVHLQGARTALLQQKGVSGIVHVVPHGCNVIADNSKLWNIYHSMHTFVQIGFGFTYKNFADGILAAQILKAKFPDVFFTALMSEAINCEHIHNQYFRELTQLISELKLEDNVAIIRGFQSDQVINSFLRTNQIALFPYKSDAGSQVFGASGAARLALATGIPTITSTIHHFSDLPTIKAESPQQIADELTKLFQDKKLQEIQRSKQLDFVKAHSWSNIAQLFADVFVSRS